MKTITFIEQVIHDPNLEDFVGGRVEAGDKEISFFVRRDWGQRWSYDRLKKEWNHKSIANKQVGVLKKELDKRRAYYDYLKPDRDIKEQMREKSKDWPDGGDKFFIVELEDEKKLRQHLLYTKAYHLDSEEKPKALLLVGSYKGILIYTNKGGEGRKHIRRATK